MILEYAPVEDLTPHETGRRLLQQMYSRQFGQPMPPIRKGSRGKPYFAGNPVYFSITHTRKHVFCAMAPHPIGIDAEELDRKIRPELAQKILSAGEFARYQESPDPANALLRLWVLKEAQGRPSLAVSSHFPALLF